MVRSLFCQQVLQLVSIQGRRSVAEISLCDQRRTAGTPCFLEAAGEAADANQRQPTPTMIFTATVVHWEMAANRP